MPRLTYTSSLPPESDVSFYLDPAGRPCVRLHAFKGRQIFELTHAIALKALKILFADINKGWDEESFARFLDICEIRCHENGTPNDPEEWKDIMLDNDAMMYVLYHMDSPRRRPLVRYTKQLRAKMVKAAKLFDLDISDWPENLKAFCRMLKERIDSLSEIGTPLEKMSRGKDGIRWRLWPNSAAKRPEAYPTPSPTPSSSPASSLDNVESDQDLELIVKNDAALAQLNRLLRPRRKRTYVHEYSDSRHILLHGPIDEVNRKAQILYDVNDDGQIDCRSFEARDITDQQVYELKAELEGVEDNIMILIINLHLASHTNTVPIKRLLAWNQVVCICTSDKDERVQPNGGFTEHWIITADPTEQFAKEEEHPSPSTMPSTDEETKECNEAESTQFLPDDGVVALVN